MKKEYSIERHSIIDLLKDIDDFETKMEKFIDKYPLYKYSVNINNDGIAWIGEVKITKDEKTTIT
jgi:hypothetical protein